MPATSQFKTSGAKHGHVLEEKHDGVPALGRTYLGIAPAADGSSPVWDVNTVRVSQEPVVLFDEESTGVFAHRAVDVVENGCLVAIHLHLVEPGARLAKEHS